MYKDQLNKLPKESLVEICNDLLEELWDNGAFSNNYILKMLREAGDNNDQ